MQTTRTTDVEVPDEEVEAVTSMLETTLNGEKAYHHAEFTPDGINVEFSYVPGQDRPLRINIRVTDYKRYTSFDPRTEIPSEDQQLFKQIETNVKALVQKTVGAGAAIQLAFNWDADRDRTEAKSCETIPSDFLNQP